MDAQITLKIILAHSMCGVINLPSEGYVTYWMEGKEKQHPGGFLWRLRKILFSRLEGKAYDDSGLGHHEQKYPRTEEPVSQGIFSWKNHWAEKETAGPLVGGGKTLCEAGSFITLLSHGFLWLGLYCSCAHRGKMGESQSFKPLLLSLAWVTSTSADGDLLGKC